MAFLKQTHVSGGLFVTGSGNFISASEFRGNVIGTASVASNLDPNADLQVKTLNVSGNALVGGDLKVMGDLTYVGVKDLRVKDKNIELNTNDSGSAVAPADGAGIVIKNSDSEGDISILYSKNGDKLVVNKPISGSITEANKVKYALKIGSGLSGAASYDGSGEVTVSLDTESVKAVKVTSASRADSAVSADKVANKLHIKIQHSGSATVESDYDGSSVVSASLDFSGVENQASANAADIVEIKNVLAEITGSGTGSVAEQIESAINALDANASVNATGTAVSGGVFVLSGVTINEADGKLTSGSATSVEVEKAGEAAKVKVELIGANSDATSSNTIWSAKNYADAKVSELSGSVAESFSGSAASTNTRLNALETASSNHGERIEALELASNSAISRLNALETTSATHVTKTAFQSYTASANGRLDSLEGATASYLAKSTFETYTSSQANVDATQSAKISALESASATHVTTASFNSYTSSANGRLNDLEATASAIDSTYVAKAGDTMSGDLNMGANRVKFGDMWMVWDLDNECIKFVVAEEENTEE